MIICDYRAVAIPGFALPVRFITADHFSVLCQPWSEVLMGQYAFLLNFSFHFQQQKATVILLIISSSVGCAL